MKCKLVIPSTYFLGATAINSSELRRYLEDTDQMEFISEIVQAQEAGLSDGEILVSFYAKLCYASLTTKKNENISKVRDIQSNLIGTIESGHGCYDAQTDVLTRDGWKPWPDVTQNDFLVTYREGHIRQSYNLIKAEDLGHTPHSYLKTFIGGSTDTGTDTPLSAPECHLLGIAIRNGNFVGNRLIFEPGSEPKVRYLTDVATEAGLVLKQADQEEHSDLLIDLHGNLLEVFSAMYNSDHEKRIPLHIPSLTRSQAQALLNGLLNSGGYNRWSPTYYDTTSRELADQLQHLCLHLGLAANEEQTNPWNPDIRQSRFRESVPLSHLLYGAKPIFRLFIDDNDNLKPKVNKHTGTEDKTFWVDDWEGNVYCAEVPNNTLYVRRNGKPVWCGNSVFEHCYLNFVVTNCSRVFTHELVRHRVGTSFSQTSGRYVKSDKLDLVIDPILDPILTEIGEFQNFVEEWYKNASDKLGLSADNTLPFSIKKKLTSALRRMMPNGQANEIGFGVNLRTLRNTIVARTSEHAEWEIRFIFNQIFDLINVSYPVLFLDAKFEVKDNLREITFGTNKL